MAPVRHTLSAPDPLIGAAREALLHSYAELRETIEALPADALDWRPAGDESNSIAVLVTHAMHSTRWWLSVAVGAPLPERDRPSEFKALASDPTALVAFAESMTNDCLALLDPSRAVDWSALRDTHERTRPNAEPQFTAGWALLHALGHLREHVGQAFLTRQLWENRPAP